MDEDDRTMEELMTKKQHPQRLHPEMWFNDPGEVTFDEFKIIVLFLSYLFTKTFNFHTDE